MDSTTSGFRFRDQGIDDSTESSDGSDDDSSSSGTGDEESELKSMTGKGIKRLCSELLELKKASADDFQGNVFANFSTFVRIFKEVEGLENELMELKQHISTQRKLLYDLTHGIYPVVSCEELIESNSERDLDTEWHHPLSELETHTNAVTETLDILISEHRLHEALLMFELEPMKLQRILSQKDFPTEIVMSYDASMSERRKSLADQFIIIVEHPRVSAPEFQKALSGLCRLGECHRANLLLLQFYSPRFEDGILDLQRSKPFMQEYIRELSKYAFSVISQAGRSFVALHGETSPYTSEFMQWAREKTELFSYHFDKYVKSISETTGGLSVAVEAVQHAISFCSLLESQKILLHPYLIKIIRPCMERVLQMHMDHFKKVIGVFTSTDPWVPGRHLVSGLGDTSYHLEIGGELEYCLLTNSGRKFLTIVQAIIEDVLPLVSLQMENSILKGLYDLFDEYVDILQRSIPNEANALEKGIPRTNLAKTLYQQLSLLANASTVVLHFLSNVTGSFFKGIKCSENEAFIEQTKSFQQRELDSWILSIQEAADRLRGYFCHQLVSKIMSLKDEQSLILETYIIDEKNDLLPSVTFQVLFLQLRRLEKLAREVFGGNDWEVEDLQRELMEAVFVWLSNNEELWTVTGEQSGDFEQFLLDMQFLVEIARFGEYFSDGLMDASLGLIERMEMKFLTAGLNRDSDVLCDGSAATAAKAAIDKLLEMEKTKCSHMEGHVDTLDKNFNKQKHGDAKDFDDEDSGRSPEDTIVDGETAYRTEQNMSKLEETGIAETTTMEKSPGSSKDSDFDGFAGYLFDNSVYLEHAQEEHSATNLMTPFLQESEETEVMSSESSMNTLMEDSDKEAAGVCVEEDTVNSCSDSDSMLDEKAVDAVSSVIEDNTEPELSAGVGTELLLEEDSSDDGDRWATTNEVEIAITEQQVSERIDLPAMERYEFIFDAGSHGQEK